MPSRDSYKKKLLKSVREEKGISLQALLDFVKTWIETGEMKNWKYI